MQHILRKDGIAAFWRGIGPALVLVINPVIQYTIFEQLKNLFVKQRLAKLRAAGPAVTAGISVLSDWDYFFLGALSKLSMYYCIIFTHCELIVCVVATSSTYPYMYASSAYDNFGD